MRGLLFIIFFCGFLQAQAQKPRYVDYKWNSRYILDKITYWKDRTVFHFRYAAFPFNGSMTFYGPLNEDRWCLVNVEDASQAFPEIELQKIIREGYTIYNIFGEDHVTFRTKPYEIYTVEVHFPALPKNVKEVDFLEGVTKKRWTNHFHCFNVKVKPFDDPDLGSPEDLKKRVDAFEIKTLGWAKTSLNQPKPPDLPTVGEKKNEPKPLPPKPKPAPKQRECQAQGKETFE
jgi:hypothetical protein